MTPHILKRVNQLTGGASLAASILSFIDTTIFCHRDHKQVLEFVQEFAC